MATKNLSDYNPALVPDGKGMKVAIIVSEWNSEVTFAMRDGAINTLLKHGVDEKDICVDYVPGTFELTYAANTLEQSSLELDAIIVIGCVIRGGTPHFEYVCQGVTYGISKLNADYEVPVIFGVLTTDNEEQAKDRAGGKLGNKGDECAIAAIKMIKLSQKYLLD